MFFTGTTLSVLLAFASISTSFAAQPHLLLAQRYHDSLDVSQYWISEKLDGVRAYWDGTQLLSRGGNKIHAPAWFTAQFPHRALDGELWTGRGQFEKTLSTVRKKSPVESEWRAVTYQLFELPDAEGDFSQRLQQLQGLLDKAQSPYLALVKQFRLPDTAALDAQLQRVIANGGEGLMMHRADSHYHTGRSTALLKVKQRDDAEARVVAHIAGKGKHLGRLGALLVEMPDGKRFRIGTGFSDAERAAPPPLGSLISYQYFGLSKKGIPRFASFHRIRHAF